MGEERTPYGVPDMRYDDHMKPDDGQVDEWMTVRQDDALYALRHCEAGEMPRYYKNPEVGGWRYPHMNWLDWLTERSRPQASVATSWSEDEGEGSRVINLARLWSSFRALSAKAIGAPDDLHIYRLCQGEYQWLTGLEPPAIETTGAPTKDVAEDGPDRPFSSLSIADSYVTEYGEMTQGVESTEHARDMALLHVGVDVAATLRRIADALEAHL